MDILGHDLLPGSGFSQKEHGSVALRRTCGLPQNAHHGGTFGNHLSAVVPIAAYSCSNGVDGLGVAVFLVHDINLDLAGDGVYNFALRVENRGHGYQTAHLFPVGRNCNMNLRDSPLLVVDLVYDALLVESACDEVIYRVI